MRLLVTNVTDAAATTTTTATTTAASTPAAVFAIAHSGQTHCTRAVPAKTAAYKRLKFLKSSTFKPKVETVTVKLSFARHKCMGDLTIVMLVFLFDFPVLLLQFFPAKVLHTLHSCKIRGSENRKRR